MIVQIMLNTVSPMDVVGQLGFPDAADYPEQQYTTAHGSEKTHNAPVQSDAEIADDGGS